MDGHLVANYLVKGHFAYPRGLLAIVEKPSEIEPPPWWTKSDDDGVVLPAGYVGSFGGKQGVTVIWRTSRRKHTVSGDFDRRVTDALVVRPARRGRPNVDELQAGLAVGGPTEIEVRARAAGRPRDPDVDAVLERVDEGLSIHAAARDVAEAQHPPLEPGAPQLQALRRRDAIRSRGAALRAAARDRRRDRRLG